MKQKANKGITLIALVITIIVMLILVAVTISMAVNGGLFSYARKSTSDYSLAEGKDELNSILLTAMIERNTTEGFDLEEFLEEKVNSIEETTEGEYKIKYKEYEAIVKEEEGGYKIDSITVKYNDDSGDNVKQPIFTTVANAPDIKGFNNSNTYYVTWRENKDEDDNIVSYEIPTNLSNLNGIAPSDWYDYTAGTNHWANIKTTGGNNDCYWVWIPRYAYKISSTNYNKNNAGTIDIVFLKGTGSTTNDIIDTTRKAEIEAAGGFKTTSGAGNWIIHPAFTNAGNGGFGELKGIWVAKFEASSNASDVVENPTAEQLEIDGGSSADTDLKVRVKPNVTSWRNITTNNVFTVCQNLTAEGNSLAGTRKLDAHMMKNTEWGAVAYLSRSIYGKNDEVWNNPYYNNRTNYSPITGLCSNEENGKDASTTDLTKTCKYNDAGGGNASTTGNVFGVYDMAGGAGEYVAGYLSEIEELSNYTTLAEANNKYKDKYVGTSSNSTTNYDENAGKYGDAVYETSSSGNSRTDSWESTFSCFPNSSSPVFRRGRHAANGSNAGVYAYDFYTGDNDLGISFRPVVLRIKT